MLPHGSRRSAAAWKFYGLIKGISGGNMVITDKSDPARYAPKLTVKPWTVKVEGLVAKPGDYGVEDLVDFKQLEERVYRHRCVEAWSMVIPWIGVPLSSVIGKVGPQPGAKF